MSASRLQNESAFREIARESRQAVAYNDWRKAVPTGRPLIRPSTDLPALADEAKPTPALSWVSPIREEVFRNRKRYSGIGGAFGWGESAARTIVAQAPGSRRPKAVAQQFAATLTREKPRPDHAAARTRGTTLLTT